MNKRTINKALKAINSAALKDLDGNITEPDTIQVDGKLLISAEHENSYLFVDYYGEYRGGYPWVLPKLVEALEKAGFSYEWENPGAISIWD